MQEWTNKLIKVRITNDNPPLASITDFIAIAKGVKSGRQPWHELIKNHPEIQNIVLGHSKFKSKIVSF